MGKNKHDKKVAKLQEKRAKAQNSIEKMRKLERELWCDEYLLKIAEFDGATIAPQNGAAARGEAMGALSARHHTLLTAGSSLKTTNKVEHAVKKGYTDDEQAAAEARVLARDQREALAIPTSEAEAWTRLVCEADACWHQAKLANDWKSFEPYVDRIVQELKHQAGLMNPDADPYDVWLDQNERGLTTNVFDDFCKNVEATVTPLVKAIREKGPQERPAFMNAHVPIETQRALSFDLMKLVGLDLADTTLATTEHPFSEGFAAGDARIATHYFENDLMSNVYSIIHEAGHTAYELGVNPNYAYTCLAGGTSMGIHESQSRFFENTVARSHAFMGPLLALLRKHVPEVYSDVDEDTLYRAVNISQPSLIRTEADELTYPLHIIVRYQIERRLFAGDITAKDIPELWKTYMMEYLGIEVPDDTRGCLQDTHWSGGSFGYFPTYALGSAYDAMYVPAMCHDHVDLDAACASGDLAPVRDWLGKNIWQWGRSKDAPELIENACSMPFDVSYYTNCLQAKFTELYSL